MDLSFSGAGFMGCYYFGVIDCWNKYIPRERVNRVAGASAGSLIAAYYLMDLSLSKCLSRIIELTEDVRRRPLGVFDRSNQIVDVLPRVLDELFPEDAHKIVSGRLFVCMTRAKDMKKIVVSEYETRQDLIDALNCSCFIPFWSGNHCSTYKGEKHIDGGFSDNLPTFDEHTIRICCFAGATDISPYDRAKLDLLSGTVLNMPFHFSLGNFKRMRHALFPPPASFIVDLLERGFHDTKNFILTNDLIQCESCYQKCSTVQARRQLGSISPVITPSVTPQMSRRFKLGEKEKSLTDEFPVPKAAEVAQFLASPGEADEQSFNSKLESKLSKFCQQDELITQDLNNNTVLETPMIMISDAEAELELKRAKLKLLEEIEESDCDSGARSRSATCCTNETNESDLDQSPIKSDADCRFSSRRASDGAALSSSNKVRTERRQSAQFAKTVPLRRNTIQAEGSSLLAIEDKFTLAPNPLPSCPPSPNLNRHCTECIRMRQDARLDCLEDEIRRQADDIRRQEPLAKKSAIKRHLGSPIKWLRQLRVKRSYKFQDNQATAFVS